VIAGLILVDRLRSVVGAAGLPDDPGDQLRRDRSAPRRELHNRALARCTCGGWLTRTQYQYTLTSSDQAMLNHWAPILEQRLRGSTSPAPPACRCPLSTVASFVNKVSPLTINHQGVFPSVTLSFNLAPGVALGDAVEQIDKVPPRAQHAVHRARCFS